MAHLSARIVEHGVFRTVKCVLCTRPWDEQWVRIALSDSETVLGSLCPLCLQRSPRDTAAVLWMQSAPLRAAFGTLPSNPLQQSTALYELGARVARLHGRTMQLCATARSLLTKSNAIQEELTRLRQEFSEAFETRQELLKLARQLSGPAPKGQALLSPKIVAELEQTATDADALLALSDHLGRLMEWPIGVHHVIDAERLAFLAHYPNLSVDAARRAVDDRYQKFLADAK